MQVLWFQAAATITKKITGSAQILSCCQLKKANVLWFFRWFVVPLCPTPSWFLLSFNFLPNPTLIAESCHLLLTRNKLGMYPQFSRRVSPLWGTNSTIDLQKILIFLVLHTFRAWVSLCLFHRHISISNTELNKSKAVFCPYTEAVCSSYASTNAYCPAPQMDSSTSESCCVHVCDHGCCLEAPSGIRAQTIVVKM